jgi:hypothetical protein
MIGRIMQPLRFLAGFRPYLAKELLALVNRLQRIVTYAANESFFHC